MNDDLLRFAVENGMLDMDALRGQMEKVEREKLLNKNPYKPYVDKNGFWCVYLPDDAKPSKRILKRRKTRKELEDVMISYWKKEEDNPTVKDVFLDWINGKKNRNEISVTTHDRYLRQFEQCFSSIKDKRIKNISECDVEDFVLSVIYEKRLTPKGFGNFRTLCYGLFRLAKKRSYVSYGIYQVFKEMEIPKKALRREVKPEEDEVFSEEETEKITLYLTEHQDLRNLGILLMFKTGLRVGELAALKKEDVKGGVIHVCRTEICHDGDKKGSPRVYEVMDHPKTDAGIRDVVLSNNGIAILKRIRLMSGSGEWLLEECGERIKTYRYRNRLRIICDTLGIKRKSPHKIRKEVATVMLDGGAPEGMITSQLGHTDIQTTKNHYYRNRKSESRKREILNEIDEL